MRTLEDDHRRKMLFFKYNFRPHASACVLEPIFHTGGVASSILAAPTIIFNDLRGPESRSMKRT